MSPVANPSLIYRKEKAELPDKRSPQENNVQAGDGALLIAASFRYRPWLPLTRLIISASLFKTGAVP